MLPLVTSSNADSPPQPLLAVTVANEESATLATNDVGVPIGRGDAIGSPVRGLAPVVCLAIQISDAATRCD